jgi:hypothetical protein
MFLHIIWNVKFNVLRSGKSTFVLNIVKHRNEICSERFGRIVFCRSPEDQTDHSRTYVDALREEFDELELVEGLPDVGLLRSGDHLLVSIFVTVVAAGKKIL